MLRSISSWLITLNHQCEVYHRPSAQDSLRPFPWPRHDEISECSPEHSGDGTGNGDPNMVKENVLDLAHMTEWSNESSTPSSSHHSMTSSTSPKVVHDETDFLEYKLAPVGSPAGKVLAHAKRVMSTLFRKHQPMIFKFGYTHSPRWRWSNTLYGYKFDRAHKWSNMVVLHQSEEASGPAMLEAMLIDIRGSTLMQNIMKQNV